MSIEFFLRLVGMIVFGAIGWWGGAELASYQGGESIRYILVLALSGGAMGLLIMPWLSVKPYEWLRSKIRQLPAQQLLWGTIGLAIGLIIASLLALPLSLLPSPFGKVFPLIAAFVFGYLGVVTMVTREMDLFNAFRSRISRDNATSASSGAVLLDTSVIIDGRIDDISSTGFIERTMLVPRFVLAELQHIADSSDSLRRNRGRRGLEVLNRLQKNPAVSVQITDMDVEGISEVDSKLVALAKELPAAVMTNDYNLNRVAELQGVRVLNINELANAVKTVVLPGELMTVEIIQEGKELGQGVGYLDDGTMVVVEDGRKHIGSFLTVNVTRVLQTVAGRMIFAQLAEEQGERSRSMRRHASSG
ncbi:MAG: PIN domain-containing protein [Chloroflexi bacterium]|nr:PIN domain-containing protein [Chloroflexota bacterium]